MGASFFIHNAVVDKPIHPTVISMDNTLGYTLFSQRLFP